MNPHNSVGTLVVGIALLSGIGCTVGPDYEAPQIGMPDAWHQEILDGLAEGEADLRTWWRVFEDPVLDGIIERAGRANLDVHVALARVEEARALARLAAGGKFPLIDGTGSYSISKASENAAALPLGTEMKHTYALGVDASWELDVFGGIRRSVESANASLEARVEDYRDLLVVLYAEVALTYIELRTLQRRLDLALQNVEKQAATLKFTRDRLDAGIEKTTQLEVSQAEANLAGTQASVPAFRTQIRRAIHRLGVLLGEQPAELYAELEEVRPIPSPPGEVVVGIPADLLRQRPDVRRAERLLAAQTAQIGVATAELYPKLFLAGSVGVQSAHLGDVLDGSRSVTYGFGPSFRWSLFSGGRIRSAIRAEEWRAEQALLQYEQSVLLALEEVENALSDYSEERFRVAAFDRSAAAAAKAAEVALTQFTQDLKDFQPVVDMERLLVLQQDALAQSEGALAANLVTLYRALGGGWSFDEDASADAASTEEPNGSGG